MDWIPHSSLKTIMNNHYIKIRISIVISGSE